MPAQESRLTLRESIPSNPGRRVPWSKSRVGWRKVVAMPFPTRVECRHVGRTESSRAKLSNKYSKFSSSRYYPERFSHSSFVLASANDHCIYSNLASEYPSIDSRSRVSFIQHPY